MTVSPTASPADVHRPERVLDEQAARFDQRPNAVPNRPALQEDVLVGHAEDVRDWRALPRRLRTAAAAPDVGEPVHPARARVVLEGPHEEVHARLGVLRLAACNAPLPVSLQLQ